MQEGAGWCRSPRTPCTRLQMSTGWLYDARRPTDRKLGRFGSNSGASCSRSRQTVRDDRHHALATAIASCTRCRDAHRADGPHRCPAFVARLIIAPGIGWAPRPRCLIPGRHQPACRFQAIAHALHGAAETTATRPEQARPARPPTRLLSWKGALPRRGSRLPGATQRVAEALSGSCIAVPERCAGGYEGL